MIGLPLAFSIILALGGLFGPLAAEAQQAAKIVRIGFLSNNPYANPARSSWASDWNSSRRPFRGLIGSLFSGSQVAPENARRRRC